jgi:Fe-S-cluster containining protein
MNDSSNLCLSCGLCCDGTLIGFVQVDNEEIPALRELLDIEEVNEKGVFLQPCNKYCDGCTIYSQRPKQCASFKCGLLKSVEQKELDFDKAIEAISEVKQLKIALEKNLALLDFKLQSQSFYFKMVELKKILEKSKSESGQRQKYQDLISDFEQFENLLQSKFDLNFS